MRKLSYLRALVIVHGKSELQICKYIRSNLRISLEFESEKNGENSIQITGLMRILNNKKFRKLSSFLSSYETVEWDKSKREIPRNFKIFIIMDTDDCTSKQKEDFINKEMFKVHWAYDYIVPIYNSPELETVLTKARVPFKKIGNERKSEYIKLFPIGDNISGDEKKKIRELINELEKNNNTNLEEFFKFCISVS